MNVKTINPEKDCNEVMRADLVLSKNGELYICDANGVCQLDCDLVMAVEYFTENRTRSEIQALQSVFSRCQRVIKTAIERKRRP
jgi:hypothetical protein